MAVLLTFLLLTVLGTVALVAAFSAAGADCRLEELGDPFDDALAEDRLEEFDAEDESLPYGGGWGA